MEVKRKGWSARVVLRYALLQVPFTGLILVVLMVLRKWLDIPVWFICGLIGFLVMKDIALFPLVWRSYDPDSPAQTNSLQGARGRAVEHLNPSGYIEVGAELWKAEIVEGGSPVQAGEHVRICSVRGLTLLVQPENERNH
jgi:membrane-bound ClpP family serine protease